jgi:hypothetical protein
MTTFAVTKEKSIAFWPDETKGYQQQVLNYLPRRQRQLETLITAALAVREFAKMAACE